MVLSPVAVAVDPWSSWWDGFWGWLGIWWHLDTLGPDLFVGLATGAAVGLVVLFAERRISARSREREVADAQDRVVDRARSALLFEIRFPADQLRRLHLDQSLIGPLVEETKAIPSGAPAEHVPAFHWVQRLAESAVELEVLADGLDARVSDHDKGAGNTGVLSIWTIKNIAEYSDTDLPTLGDWTWKWHDGPIPAQVYRGRVEQDPEMGVMITQYARQRRLIRAYRAAFLHTLTYMRAEESEAILERAKVLGSPIRQRRAQRRLEGRIRASKRWADLQAVEIVSQIDPNAV